MDKFDSYTLSHLDAWLVAQINGDTQRAAIRDRMVSFAESDDAEYWSAQGWWNLYDRADCDQLRTQV